MHEPAAGLTINPASGLISGTPSAAVGLVTVGLSATNASGTGTANLALTVNPPPPSITSATTATAVVGTAFNYQIVGTNSPTSYNANEPACGPDRQHQYRPDYRYARHLRSDWSQLDSPRQMRAAQARKTSPSRSIRHHHRLPARRRQTAVVGTAFNYQIVGTNSPTSYNATNLPAGLTVNTSTGQITGTPSSAVGTVNSWTLRDQCGWHRHSELVADGLSAASRHHQRHD